MPPVLMGNSSICRIRIHPGPYTKYFQRRPCPKTRRPLRAGYIPVHPASTLSKDGATLLWHIPGRSAAAFLTYILASTIFAKDENNETRIYTKQVLEKLQTATRPPLRMQFKFASRPNHGGSQDAPSASPQRTFNSAFLPAVQYSISPGARGTSTSPQPSRDGRRRQPGLALRPRVLISAIALATGHIIPKSGRCELRYAENHISYYAGRTGPAEHRLSL